MARILWWGIGPEHNTGYGLGTRWYVPRIAALGHEVVIAVMGVLGRDDDPAKAHPDARERLETGHWQGHRVIGPGAREFGLPPAPVIRAAFGGHEPDLVIALKDPWVLDPKDCKGRNVAVWANVDCVPIAEPDRQFFEASGTRFIATSQFAHAQARKAGLDSLLVPFAVTPEFVPGDQGAARDLLGLSRNAFLAGINAANIGPRKGWGEQFSAFAQHARRDARAMLMVHATPKCPKGMDPLLFEGMDLRQLAFRKGLNGSPDEPMPGDRVIFGSHQRMTHAQMMTWYQALDVLLACSYGEGVGMPIQEAIRCGKPVIGTGCSAITEMIGASGYVVGCQGWWHPHYQAEWHIPRVRDIVTALGKIASKPRRNWECLAAGEAPRFDADMVTREHWKPALDILLKGA